MTDELDPQQLERLQEIFYVVEPLPQEERAARIAQECNGDVVLERVVTQMIESGAEAEEFVEGLFGVDVIEDKPEQLIGQIIDDYRIEELVGTGGMGFVFRAVHQSPDLDQVVAIKILRSAFLNRSMQQRFAREAKILARLNHPNIARFSNIGLYDGRPYFIMEFVDGVRIDKYCADNHLDIPARLALFRTVLNAVAFTQRHLIIHRDLKPQNIFVTTSGDIKVLDFGIGKFLAEESPGSESLTRAVGPMLTPQAAAPEQWEGDNTTTATDVYALAVLLFNLLSGAAPYQRNELKKMGANGTWPDDPPGMLQVLNANGNIEVAARERALTPQTLRQMLRGDLQTIVSKAMATLPDARYDSAAQFRQEIDNYLANRPLLARPPSTLYAARKFLRRNARAAGFATALMIMLGALVLQVYLESAREKQRALEMARERDKALASAQLLKDVFSTADPILDSANNITVREALVNNAPQLLEQQQDSPKVQIALAATIGQILTDIGAFHDAEAFLDQVVTLANGLRENGQAGLTEERAYLDARRRLVTVYGGTDRLGKALNSANNLMPLFAQYFGAAAEPRLSLMNTLTEIYGLKNDTNKQQDAADAALAYAQEHPQLKATGRAIAINNHALAYRLSSTLEATLERLTEARNVAATSIPDTHPLYARLTANLAAGYLVVGDDKTAAQLYKEVVATINQQGAAPNQSMTQAAYGLGVLQMKEGNFESAQEQFRSALALQQRFGEDSDQRNLLFHFALGSCLEMTGDIEQARHEYEFAATTLAQRFPNHHGLPKFYARLAALELDTGHHAAAAKHLRIARQFADVNATEDVPTSTFLEAIDVMLNNANRSQSDQQTKLQALFDQASKKAGEFDIPIIKMRRWLTSS